MAAKLGMPISTTMLACGMLARGAWRKRCSAILNERKLMLSAIRTLALAGILVWFWSVTTAGDVDDAIQGLEPVHYGDRVHVLAVRR